MYYTLALVLSPRPLHTHIKSRTIYPIQASIHPIHHTPYAVHTYTDLHTTKEVSYVTRLFTLLPYRSYPPCRLLLNTLLSVVGYFCLCLPSSRSPSPSLRRFAGLRACDARSGVASRGGSASCACSLQGRGGLLHVVYVFFVLLLMKRARARVLRCFVPVVPGLVSRYSLRYSSLWAWSKRCPMDDVHVWSYEVLTQQTTPALPQLTALGFRLRLGTGLDLEAWIVVDVSLFRFLVYVKNRGKIARSRAAWSVGTGLDHHHPNAKSFRSIRKV